MRALLLRRLRHQLLGLVFLLVAALFFTLCVAVYNKAFTEYVGVRLETDHIGNQMREGADVKVRGMLVGEVRTIEATGDKAVLGLALQPDKVDLIPANVSARLLPKTLFGERYVALELPDRGSDPIAEGAVIGQDRSSSAIELERVLSDVLPLLQSVQPQKLASTLGAVSEALEGKGQELGETLVQVSDYLGELNPSLPELKADITGLANVSDVYDRAAPDFLAALSDLTTTSKTIVEKERQLVDLYASVSTVSVDLGRFLDVNKANLIDLTSTVQPTLDVLAKYAPEYPCLLRQLAEAVPRAEEAFGKGTDEMNHVTIRITASRGKYLPGVDEPRYDDKRGPRCYPQVEPPAAWPQYPPEGAIEDGSSKPAPPHRTGYGGGTTAGVPSLANSPAEHELLSTLLAPSTGIAPQDAPGWASLLVGPLYRGAVVEVE
ncbi:ABC transporter substrate-binding protein [Prauserella marina]|uniref:Virulence factor Mce family protein n=1 Tax=Prauserella marina TaxID=530584 RepID=A0A222VU50_9PSEU|nr:MCE family protein [Prauserella marina]ASR37457.1 ABC transporter substrate-binding protein [Prauserella marina]PWV74654.1 virulence factor Mce-like protein [Prauserella marina]SDD44197.1 virulence factor Mce family protein [Prauserella marina]